MRKFPRASAAWKTGYAAADLAHTWEEIDGPMSMMLTMYTVPKDARAWDPSIAVDQHSTYDDLTNFVPDIEAFARRTPGEREFDTDWLLKGGAENDFESNCFPVSVVRDSIRAMDSYFNRYAYRFPLFYQNFIKYVEYFLDDSDTVYRIMAGDNDFYAMPAPFRRGGGPVVDFREGRGPKTLWGAIRNDDGTYRRAEQVTLNVKIMSLWERAHGPEFLALAERAREQDHKIYVTRG